MFVFIFFECILDRVRRLGIGPCRGPVHWGSVFCRSPSDVTLHPFSFDLHRSSTAIDIKEKNNKHNYYYVIFLRVADLNT